MPDIDNSTYHCSVISLAVAIHTGPVAFVLFSLGGLAAIHFVAVFTIFSIPPSIQFHGDFIIMAVSIAGWSSTSPLAVFGIWGSCEGTAQQTVLLFRVPSDWFCTSTWLVFNLEEASFAGASAVSDIAIRDSSIIPEGFFVGILGKS